MFQSISLSKLQEWSSKNYKQETKQKRKENKSYNNQNLKRSRQFF